MNDERPLEDELLELIGHRFRRSLINIVDLANLELTINSADKSDLVASLTRIKAESMQTLSIADALLSLAQRDKTPVPCEPFDLVALVQQLAPDLQRQAADTGMTLTIDAPKLPIEVVGSAETVRAMLPLLLEFALSQIKLDALQLQIIRDPTAAYLSLQTTGHTVSQSYTLRLSTLLDLLVYIRLANSCRCILYYAQRDVKSLKLSFPHIVL